MDRPRRPGLTPTPSPDGAATEEHGVTGLASHVPSQMTPAILGAADLILAATGDHMRTLLRDVPRAMTRTFTLRELAALVREMDARTGGAWRPPAEPTPGRRRRRTRSRVRRRRPGRPDLSC